MAVKKMTKGKWVVAGLGNPGEEYARTRHNVGWLALDALAKSRGAKKDEWEESKNAHALYRHEKIGGNAVELLKPLTFMNKSGSAVAYAAKKHNIPPERTLVIHDDIDMPLGSVKIVFGRGSGGHKGVESVFRSLKTRDFPRVKIGVLPTTPAGKSKKPKGEEKVQKFILGDFTPAEQKTLAKVLKTAAHAVETTVALGLQKAMNECN